MISLTTQFQDALLHTVSGTQEEKITGSLELIRSVTGFDAITLSSFDKANRPVVGFVGHDSKVASFLSSEKFEGDTVQIRQVAHPNQLLAWEDVNFGETSHAQEVLVPSGYHNGVSVPILIGASRPIGMLHCNLSRPVFDRSLFAFLIKLRPVLHHLIKTAMTADPPVHLSERECEIMMLIAEGKTNPEIASDLYLSRSTVATHIERILRKIDASNRVQAAIWWDRHGTPMAQSITSKRLNRLSGQSRAHNDE